MFGSIVKNIIEGSRVRVKRPYYDYEHNVGVITGYSSKRHLALVNINGMLGAYPLSKLKRLK